MRVRVAYGCVALRMYVDVMCMEFVRADDYVRVCRDCVEKDGNKMFNRSQT